MAFLSSTFRLSPLERVKFCSPTPPCPILPRRVFGILLSIVSIAILGLGPARGQSDASKEYQIKAAFLFNFAQFVKWPPASFSTADAPFCIGILGDDPFGGALEETVQGEAIDTHKLRVEHASRYEDLKDCQIIFVCKSEEGHLAEILSDLNSKPVLTVSEISSFAQSGGDIDFYLQAGKVRFEINPLSARRAGLKISSQLLNLGRIVEP